MARGGGGEEEKEEEDVVNTVGGTRFSGRHFNIFLGMNAQQW